MSSSSENRQLRVGIVGAGYVSVYHIRAVQSLGFAQVVGIVDRDQTRAAAVASQFGIPNVFTDLSDLQNLRPDVIHILTPPESHCFLTIQALEMGAHVMVEKPMAETAADCDRMIAKARETGRVLSVNHSARMDPIVLQALDLVRKGACGDVLGVDFFRSSDYPGWPGGPVPPPYRNGSYPFQDLGVHGLYLVEAFIGELRDVNVQYRSSGLDPNLCFDEWRASVQSDTAAGQMYISWNVRPMQNELVVHGTRGVMHVDCLLQTCTLRKTYPLPKAVQRLVAAGVNSLSLQWQVARNLVRFVTKKLRPSPGIHESVVRFYQALHKGETVPVSAEEGRRMVGWMEEVSIRADEDKRRMFALPEPSRPARILVTGATGFVGKALLRRLRQSGETVRVLVRRRSAALEADPNIQLVFGDLGDKEAVDKAVRGIDVVYHVGAAMKGSGADFERGTVQGTRNVVEACIRYGVSRFVHVSSMSVLDHAGHRGNAVTESSPLEPFPEQRGFYTQTKLEAEKIVLDAVRSHGLPAVILRPGQIFGPGTESVSPSGSFGLAGRWIVAGKGDLPLPLVYVDDVVDALILAGTRPGVEGLIVQLVDDDSVTQREYIDQRQQWSAQKVMYCPRWLLMSLALGVETLGKVLGRSVPLSRYRIRSLRPLAPCDCTVARQQLGWSPGVGTREGLQRTFLGKVEERDAEPVPVGR